MSCSVCLLFTGRWVPGDASQLGDVSGIPADNEDVAFPVNSCFFDKNREGEGRMKPKKENQVVYGPQPPPKFMTTRGLIIRGIIFFAAIAGALYLIWQEFSGK